MNVNSSPTLFSSNALDYTGFDAQGQARKVYVTSNGTSAGNASIGSDGIQISLSKADYDSLRKELGLSVDANVQTFEVTDALLQKIRGKVLQNPSWSAGVSFNQALQTGLQAVQDMAMGGLFPSTARFLATVSDFASLNAELSRSATQLKKELTQKALEIAKEIAASKEEEAAASMRQMTSHAAGAGTAAVGGAAGLAGASYKAEGKKLEVQAAAAPAGAQALQAQAAAKTGTGSVWETAGQSTNAMGNASAQAGASASTADAQKEQAEQTRKQAEAQLTETLKTTAEKTEQSAQAAVSGTAAGIGQVGHADKALGT
jgi:hypothetical protein